VCIFLLSFHESAELGDFDLDLDLTGDLDLSLVELGDFGLILVVVGEFFFGESERLLTMLGDRGRVFVPSSALLLILGFTVFRCINAVLSSTQEPNR